MYDDIASAPKGNESERRGAAGTTFIYKILGAASENGIQKEELISLGKKVRDATRTLSVGIEGCISPINGKPIFTLEKDEIFIGMGVHGESGYGRQKLTSSFKIVEFITDRILEDYEINSGDIVIPFVNGSGKTTLMELLIIFNDLENYLSNRGIKIFYSKYKAKNISEFKNKKVITFAGIGNPENFFDLLKDNKIDILEKIKFPDHYKYSVKVLENLTNKAKENNTILLTTEKDYLRISENYRHNINYLKIEVEIENRNQFIDEIKKII